MVRLFNIARLGLLRRIACSRVFAALPEKFVADAEGFVDPSFNMMIPSRGDATCSDR